MIAANSLTPSQRAALVGTVVFARICVRPATEALPRSIFVERFGLVSRATAGALAVKLEREDFPEKTPERWESHTVLVPDADAYLTRGAAAQVAAEADAREARAAAETEDDLEERRRVPAGGAS